MPLLYGQGPKAFLRLQQEIIRQTNDESLFAWLENRADRDDTCNILANDITSFRYSGEVRSADRVMRLPYSVTNQCLDIQSVIRQVPGEEIWLLALNCEYGSLTVMNWYYPRVNDIEGGRVKSAVKQTYHPCVIALTKVRNRYLRIAAGGLGDHLNEAYWYAEGTEVGSNATQHFIVRLQRYDNEYEAANIVLNNKVRRLLQAKARRYRLEKAGHDNAMKLV
nr:hypothetical protein B0A51_03797 [Rachicladosporium sp. CCFEE 5018]